MRCIRIAFLAGDGGDVHNTPIACRAHMRHQGAGDDEGRDQINLNHAAPFRHGQFPDRRIAAGDAGIIDQNIHAPMGSKRRLRRGFHRRRVRQIKDMGADFGVTQARGGCLGCSLIHIPNGDGSPPARGQLRHRQPNAARCPGNHRNPAVQISFWHLALPVFDSFAGKTRPGKTQGFPRAEMPAYSHSSRSMTPVEKKGETS